MIWKYILPSNTIFYFYLFILVSYIPVHENHKHVQDWNVTNKTFFPLFFVWFLSVFIIIIFSYCVKVCGGGIPTMNIFMIFMNRNT